MSDKKDVPFWAEVMDVEVKATEGNPESATIEITAVDGSCYSRNSIRVPKKFIYKVLWELERFVRRP